MLLPDLIPFLSPPTSLSQQLWSYAIIFSVSFLCFSKLLLITFIYSLFAWSSTLYKWDYQVCPWIWLVWSWDSSTLCVAIIHSFSCWFRFPCTNIPQFMYSVYYWVVSSFSLLTNSASNNILAHTSWYPHPCGFQKYRQGIFIGRRVGVSSTQQENVKYSWSVVPV